MTRKKKPESSPDVTIGRRIRTARIANELTQKQLGDLIGVSYQQVQKYESGNSRVAGGRFDRLVTALRRPVGYFFPNATDVRSPANPIVENALSSEKGQRLVAAYARLGTTTDRNLAVEFVERLAANGAPK